MSDIRQLRRLARRVGQAEVIERPAVSGQSTLVETGTYTPTYQGGTTGGVTTYTIQEGYWTRVGNIVTVQGTLVWTAATGTGDARISLPFTSAQRGTGALRVISVTFAAGTPQIVLGADAYFTMISPATNAAGTTVQMEAAGNIVFQVTYRI